MVADQATARCSCVLDGFIAAGALAGPMLASSVCIAFAGLLGKPWGFYSNFPQLMQHHFCADEPGV